MSHQDGLLGVLQGWLPRGYQPLHLILTPASAWASPTRPRMPDNDDLRRNPPCGLPMSEPPWCFWSANKEGVFLKCALLVAFLMSSPRWFGGSHGTRPPSSSPPTTTFFNHLGTAFQSCFSGSWGSTIVFPAAISGKTLTLPPWHRPWGVPLRTLCPGLCVPHRCSELMAGAQEGREATGFVSESPASSAAQQQKWAGVLEAFCPLNIKHFITFAWWPPSQFVGCAQANPAL